MLDASNDTSLETLSLGTRDWPHAPPHRLAEAGVYFVTARCYLRRHLLDTDELKDFFLSSLMELSSRYGWRLEAWCVLSNHYHLVGHSPAEGARNLGRFLGHLHSNATRERNRIDDTPGRRGLWHNFRETELTEPKRYMARLNYVHSNAVHHRLVPEARDWRWSSAAAFESAVTRAWARTIYGFQYGLIAEADDDVEEYGSK